MTNQNQELLFIFAGMTYAGALLLALAVFVGLRKLRTPKPPKIVAVDTKEKDWEDMTKRWRK